MCCDRVAKQEELRQRTVKGRLDFIVGEIERRAYQARLVELQRVEACRRAIFDIVTTIEAASLRVRLCGEALSSIVSCIERHDRMVCSLWDNSRALHFVLRLVRLAAELLRFPIGPA